MKTYGRDHFRSKVVVYSLVLCGANIIRILIELEGDLPIRSAERRARRIHSSNEVRVIGEDLVRANASQRTLQKSKSKKNWNGRTVSTTGGSWNHPTIFLLDLRPLHVRANWRMVYTVKIEPRDGGPEWTRHMSKSSVCDHPADDIQQEAEADHRANGKEHYCFTSQSGLK